MEPVTTKNKFIIKPLSSDQLTKIINDLKFISLLAQVAKEKQMRVVIGGGYAVDGALGKLTRPHNDIDIQIYGNNSNGNEVVRELFDLMEQNGFDSSKLKTTDKKESTFYHNYLAEKPGFGADIYYIRLQNSPFDKRKTIIRNDGLINESQEYETHIVSLNGVSFEAVLPKNELDDKVLKKNRGEKQRDEIDQDIKNLKILLNEK